MIGKAVMQQHQDILSDNLISKDFFREKSRIIEQKRTNNLQHGNPHRHTNEDVERK